MLLRLLQSRYYWLIPVLFWFFIASASEFWNLSLFNHSIRDIAFERGRIMYEMVRLTKINPVLMATDPTIFKKQSMEHIRYRVVSRKPMNPENEADAWEAVALSRFKDKSDPVFQPFLDSEERFFRYIGPVYMQKGCLTCHGHEDAKVGDVRGGISVAVMMEPIVDSHIKTRHTMIFMHIIGFILISSTSVFFMHHLRNHWRLLNQTRDELKDKEQFLSDVTNSMGEGFVVLNPQGEVTFFNPECKRLLGWSFAEIAGHGFTDLVYRNRHDERFDPAQCAINLTLSDGVTRKEKDDLFINKQGRAIAMALSVSPLIKDGRPNGVVVTFDDMTELKRAEEERSHLERQLNQTHKMEAVGQLAGGIAHEINTPIQYIGDNLHFLKEAYEDISGVLEVYGELLRQASEVEALKPRTEVVAEAIEAADLGYLKQEISNAIEQSIAGGQQVAHIVQAMKEFAHPGSKQLVPADLNRIISNTVAVCKNEWKYVADMQLQLAQDLPQVECLGGEISQVVLNLIVNAAQAIADSKREEKGVITISSQLSGDQVEMRITDTGTGIPQEVQGYVFNPFFTTKDVGKGTGQGLAIAQDIVMGKHCGELFFETEEGVGTTFVLRLPVSQGES
ncbi:MAG: DUF3365 domain-containing protein [Candidatus Thiodiazotropha sp. (ex Epidulcina cf. delphinae)]|nr:DUF3365 domain-containing protein [Candidatus Thiodiazotropha sp. (ex Epidulcina cf. delphinae)]